jgi:hypothetical protein
MFRPYLPWLVLRLTILLSLALLFLITTFWLHELRWLAGTMVMTIIAVLAVLSHLAHAIIVSDASLICRRGVIRVRESVIPIWSLDYEIRQTLPGRVLGYGTVLISTNGTTMVLRHIAPIRTLQREIAHRQADFAPPNWFRGR